ALEAPPSSTAASSGVDAATVAASQMTPTLGQLRVTLKTASEAQKGTTRLGHALSKHAGRRPDIWGKLKGDASTWHEQAMKQFRDIFDAPGSFQRVP
ncbi:MAG: hypothetical protein AAFV36_05765, partial [Myxococcota bacterium]